MDVIALKPAGEGNLRNQIYEQLRSMIQRGGLAPDQKLVDVAIASQLGVSRMPVRDALMQLMHQGYLVGTTRGFVLPTLTASDIANIFEVRRCLEPRAAARAADRLDAQGLAKLETALSDARKAVEAGDAETFFQANSLFRNTWLAAVGNDWLSSTISRFADHVLVVRLRTLSHPPTQAIVLAGMQGIYDAFARRDSIAVFDLVTRFIENAEDRFVALSKELDAAGHNTSTTMRTA